SVLQANAVGNSTVLFMPTTSNGSRGTIRPSLTRRPYINARSGWNHYLQRANTGMGCGAFACEDSGGSTAKPRSSQLGKISNACSESGDGDGVRFQQRRWLFPRGRQTRSPETKR